MNINSTALLRSTIAVIWLIAGMTILAEISPEFKSFLVQLATHHWIGKSVISAVAFVAFYALFARSRESHRVLGGTFLVVGSVVLAGLGIFAFFVWHFLNT